MHSSLLILIPLLPFLGAAVNLLGARRLPRAATHIVAVSTVALAFIVGLVSFFQVHGLWSAYVPGASGESFPGLVQNVFAWIHVGDLQLDMAFRFDTLTAVMVLVITGVGTLIHIYSMGYMHDDPRYAAYFGYLNLFTGSMLVLVLADNLIVMFIGWEGVGLCSYLLIGFWFQETKNANAGRKAFIVNRVGDFAFLLGVCILFWATGTVGFRELQDPSHVGALTGSFFGTERVAFFAGLLLFIGACGKSAQIPLYVWLPDAMAGPTPVSALIHAATMVTAGVYMIARMSFVYAHSASASAIVAGVGAATALFAAIMAFAQTDLKKVLAYSTVSQLGFMFVGVGVGAYVAGIFHLMTHAVFKAGLFLAAGSVMHAMSGSGAIMKMGGLKKKLPRTHIAFAIYCLAIAGIFPGAGFFSKDEILAGAALAEHADWWPWFGRTLWVVLTVAAMGTAFYMYRLYYLVFAGESRADEETKSHIHESPSSMTVPLLILAGLSLTVGFLGLPHIGGLPNAMASWLGPVLVPAADHHASQTTLVVLILIALGGAIAAWAAARAVYGKGPSLWVTKQVMGPMKPLHRVVKNKFFVDEIYDAIIVKPLRGISKALYHVVDRFLIDGFFVMGTARVVDATGRVARWFQNGQVQRYLVVLLVGGAGMFYLASRQTLDIDYVTVDSGVVRFAADVGGGAGAADAEVEWDFNGDGRADSTDIITTWDFGAPGTYEVVLRAKEPVFGREREVVRTIMVPGGVSTQKGARR